MTTTMVDERAPERAEPRLRSAHRSREALIFTAATAVGVLHGLDDAFFHRQPGVGLGQHALAAAIMLVIGLGAVVAYPFMRPAARFRGRLPLRLAGDGEAYDRAAGRRPLDVWYLPDVSHTGAIREVAPEYEQRVTAFFDDALRGG